MNKKKFPINTPTINSLQDILDLSQIYLISAMDAILLLEHLRRKKQGVSFNDDEVSEFKKLVYNNFSKYLNNTSIPSSNTPFIDSFVNPLIENAIKAGKQEIVNMMKKTSLYSAIDEWLNTLKLSTRKGYEKGLQNLINANFINITNKTTLFQFANVPHDLILSKIFNHPEWKFAILTRSATAYKNFIKFLNNKTDGIISFLTQKPKFPKNRVLPPREKISTKNIKKVLSLVKEFNPRDYCLINLYITSPFNLCNILSFTKGNINLNNYTITYTPTPNTGPVIFKSKPLIAEISNCIVDFTKKKNSDYLFCTRNGNPLDPMQLTRSLQKAFQRATIKPLSIKDLKKNYSQK